MKLTIEKNVLVPMLTMLKHGINSNTILPILDNIKIYTKDGLLYMQTSDNNMTVTVSKPSDKLGLDADYSFLLHSSAIPLLNQLKSGEIEIEANPEANIVRIKQEKNVYKYGMENILDYPSDDKSEYKEVCEVDFSVFKEELSNALIFVSQNSSMVAMGGILLEINNQKITIVATDAHILLKSSIACNGDVCQSMIIPTKIVQALKTVKHTGVMKISTSHNACTFSFGNTVLKQRLIDENYPKYEAVMPTKVDTCVSVNKNEFVETLKRLGMLANQTTHGIALVFNDKKMCIVATDIDKGTDGKEYLNSNSETDSPRFIGINESFMSKVMPCIKSDMIELILSNANRGAITINEHSEDGVKTILIMPIMLADTIETFQKLLA